MFKSLFSLQQMRSALDTLLDLPLPICICQLLLQQERDRTQRRILSSSQAHCQQRVALHQGFHCCHLLLHVEARCKLLPHVCAQAMAEAAAG